MLSSGERRIQFMTKNCFYYFFFKVEIPKAGQDYVSVQVKACGLSKPPYPAVREVFSVGDIPLLHRLPIGYEISGYVHAVGSQVTTLRPGDAVVGRFFSSTTIIICNGFKHKEKSKNKI